MVRLAWSVALRLSPSFSLAKQWLLRIRCREDFTIWPLGSQTSKTSAALSAPPLQFIHGVRHQRCLCHCQSSDRGCSSRQRDDSNHHSCHSKILFLWIQGHLSLHSLFGNWQWYDGWYRANKAAQEWSSQQSLRSQFLIEQPRISFPPKVQ